jgi:enoyl-CoA hydratase
LSVQVSREGALATITLDRAPVNAFDMDQLNDLDRAVAGLEATRDVGCLLIRGRGVFSAGADIAMLNGWRDATDSARRLREVSGRMQEVFAHIASFPAVTLAAISRAATGGGLELALACDFRIAGQAARIGLPEVKLGLIPAAGGTQRLVRLAGLANATRLVVTGALITGSTAVQYGIVHEAVPDDELDARAHSFAAELAELPRHAVVAAKRCLAVAPSEQGFAEELTQVGDLIESTLTRALLASFLSSR